jgi:hypothetical protein
MKYIILGMGVLHKNKIIQCICITLMRVMHVRVGLDSILSMYP